MFPIVQAGIEDYDSIMALYNQATTALLEQGINQWDNDYPSGSTLKDNLVKGHSWIMRSGDEVISTITLDEDQDDQYLHIQWTYPADRVLVVHRLCVHPDFQSQGIAKHLMQFAGVYAVEYRYAVLRLDAYLGNFYSQKLYRTMGFHEAVGYCYYPPASIMCNCFEKRM